MTWTRLTSSRISRAPPSKRRCRIGVVVVSVQVSAPMGEAHETRSDCEAHRCDSRPLGIFRHACVVLHPVCLAFAARHQEKLRNEGLHALRRRLDQLDHADLRAGAPEDWLGQAGEERDELHDFIAEFFDGDDDAKAIIDLLGVDHIGESDSESDAEGADAESGADPIAQAATSVGLRNEIDGGSFGTLPWRFAPADGGARVGSIHRMGRAIKATCSRHPSCICCITCKSEEAEGDIKNDLVMWLGSWAGGADEHQERSLALRRDKYKMRVRK